MLASVAGITPQCCKRSERPWMRPIDSKWRGRQTFAKFDCRVSLSRLSIARVGRHPDTGCGAPQKKTRILEVARLTLRCNGQAAVPLGMSVAIVMDKLPTISLGEPPAAELGS